MVARSQAPHSAHVCLLDLCWPFDGHGAATRAPAYCGSLSTRVAHRVAWCRLVPASSASCASPYVTGEPTHAGSAASQGAQGDAAPRSRSTTCAPYAGLLRVVDNLSVQQECVPCQEAMQWLCLGLAKPRRWHWQ